MRTAGDPRELLKVYSILRDKEGWNGSVSLLNVSIWNKRYWTLPDNIIHIPCYLLGLKAELFKPNNIIIQIKHFLFDSSLSLSPKYRVGDFLQLLSCRYTIETFWP